MKTLTEVNKEYCYEQTGQEHKVQPITTSNVDDVLLYAIKAGHKELVVEPAEMILLISFCSANFARPEGEWWKVVVEGWIDKFMGITFHRADEDRTS